MNRLIEKMVFSGLVIAWRRATWPTSRSPSLVNATTEGVVRPPSELGITTGSPPSMTATNELVVPRSIPITFPMFAPRMRQGRYGQMVRRRATGPLGGPGRRQYVPVREFAIIMPDQKA